MVTSGGLDGVIFRRLVQNATGVGSIPALGAMLTIFTTFNNTSHTTRFVQLKCKVAAPFMRLH